MKSKFSECKLDRVEPAFSFFVRDKQTGKRCKIAYWEVVNLGAGGVLPLIEADDGELIRAPEGERFTQAVDVDGLGGPGYLDRIRALVSVQDVPEDQEVMQWQH